MFCPIMVIHKFAFDGVKTHAYKISDYYIFIVWAFAIKFYKDNLPFHFT